MVLRYLRDRLAGPAALALCASCALAGAEGVVPPAADPAVVLAGELQRALDAGSNAAIINFIARHPDESLTVEARERLAARARPDAAAGDGPDAEIYAAFDAARLAGTPEAMAAFARRYANHPLAAEALRPFWTEGSPRP